MRNSSFAVSSKGVVYAWGDNAKSELALDADGRSIIPRPEPIIAMCPQKVNRIEVKGWRKVLNFLKKNKSNLPKPFKSVQNS